MRRIFGRDLRVGRITADEFHIVLLPIFLRKWQPRANLRTRLHTRVLVTHRQLVIDVMLDRIDYRVVRRFGQFHELFDKRRRIEILLGIDMRLATFRVLVETKQIRNRTS